MNPENPNIDDVLVQQLRAVDNNGNLSIAFPFQTFVYRYPVPDGWIVATIAVHGGSPAIAQSFVYDPGRDWNPSTFQPPANKTQTASQT